MSLPPLPAPAAPPRRRGTRRRAVTRRRAAASAVLLTAAGLAPVSGQTGQGAPAARIVVEPDILVSRDGGGAHVELHVASHPWNAGALVGAAITHGRPDGSPGTRTYASKDGGSSWREATFPEQRQWGGADPQVAFTAAGAALFATLTTHADETGRTRAFLNVYRSADGGFTWSAPADLGASYDHPMMAVDPTTGPFAGSTYISVLFGREYSLGVFRSRDDGRTFVGPVVVTSGNGIGLNVTPMVVLSDGALLMTWHDFPIAPAERARPGPRGSTQWTALSQDGGVTFGPARRGPAKVYPAYDSDDMRLFADPAFAADRSARYRDRIYMAWTDHATGTPRVLLSRSGDRGATWSEPRPVDASAPAGARQFQPTLAVNRDGILGVAWYDTRGVEGELGFHEYFSASLDGGVTFLPPVRVSSEASRPFGSGNLTYTPTTFTSAADSGAVRLVFLSAAGRWASGGDYLGMAAGADGAFHPFWADARTGTYEAWTARIRIDTTGTTPAAPPDLETRDVTTSIEIVPDPTRIDEASGTVELRLRLRNTGERALYGPLSLTIEKFGSGLGEELRELAPEILDPSNGRTGAGAVLDFTPALGSAGMLEPGATSGAVLLRFRMKDPLRVPDMHLRIHGRVRAR